MKDTSTQTVYLVQQEIFTPGFDETVETLLMDLLLIDTSPQQSIAELRKAEHAVFEKIRACLEGLAYLKGRVVQHPVSPAIEDHEYYSKVFPYPSFQEQSAAEVYADRYNLLFLVDAKAEKEGRNVGLNAHIDVVSPYFPPARDGSYIRGRGSTDDKGNVLVIIGALLVLDALKEKWDIDLKGNLACMFVIDEELGGNGSLSVAMDHQLRNNYYDSLLILECAGKQIYPGNRGAVFFKMEGSVVPAAEPPLLEAFAYGILSIIMEGERIKQESSHPLFPRKPVYTCAGILGPFGLHPSGICDFVEFHLTGGNGSLDIPDVSAAVEAGLRSYFKMFSDKSSVIDPLSGKPKIEKHFTIEEDESGSLRICVYGSGGHMGSLPENDAAVVKWAFIVRELAERKAGGDLSFSLYLPGTEKLEKLIFEGAQSFLPCHTMKDVAARLEDAFRSGVRRFGSGIDWAVSFDKLHNEAYVVDPESGSVQNAVNAALEAGTITEKPKLTGWDASCDARIFAREYPSLPVITTGPGDLNGAHSDKEALLLSDLYESILCTVLFILKETHTVLP